MMLSEINLLEELDKPELAELRSALRKRSVKDGQAIYSPHEAENAVCILLSGKARVYLLYGGKEFNLGILGEGEIFSSHTGAHVQAMGDCVLLTTDLHNFREALGKNPAFAKTMVRVLGRLLKNSFATIESLAFKDSAKRVAELLLAEAKVRGTPEAGGTLVAIDLTTEQIAQFVGATRQTVSTLINSLIRDGLLTKRGRGVYFISDLGVLGTLAAE